MTRARSEQVSLDSTPYYHCICRCVRRAFLCGDDHVTGHNFDHRKQWLVDRIKQLASVFSIEICAYAVMSNHYHLVLRIDREAALALADDEVIERWYTLFNGYPLVNRYLLGEKQSKAELVEVKKLVELWRKRLYDLGWYMRCLNESIARQANEEDNCKGRFWEGRYKSQALLDEAALLSCMAYVDLNPIRAGISQTPEKSEFTSIYERIQAVVEKKKPSKVLAKFKQGKQLKSNEIPMREVDYFELVDLTGRVVREDKKGHIPNHLASILIRLGIKPESWFDCVQKMERRFYFAVGSEAKLQALCWSNGKQWTKGVSASREWFH